MRKISPVSFLLCVFAHLSFAQQPQQPDASARAQLEMLTEQNDDAETEDDSYLQALVQYRRHPVNVNTATESDFFELHLLTPLQVKNFLAYRARLGNFLSIYELQAVPGWDSRTLERIRPYIIAASDANLISSFKSRLKSGTHRILFRASQTLERSAGYRISPDAGKSYYEGSPQKFLVRYAYNYKNLLQYGVLGEKDPGEQFFRTSQKQGFDFYSAHFFLKNSGCIKAFALGDYTVNLGQGLIQWMSLAFKKSPDISSIKREADVLRPYNSAGEINFHRGAGITLAKKKWEATAFFSLRKLDANFAAADSVTSNEDYVTSLQTSGYHRTPGEIADKGSQRQIAFGGNISHRAGALHLGVNGIHYLFKYPLIKQAEPYNLYALSGSSFGNYSIDYGYSFRNMHAFGEVAATEHGAAAVLSGLLVSVATDVDMSIVYRNISKRYQSLYSNAFTENTVPSNEKGIFSGITVRPAPAWRFDGYIDAYKFPWLKYRVNAPVTGFDHQIQLDYKPNKVLEIFSRYKTETKPINFDTGTHALSPVVPQSRADWRTELSYRLSRALSFRNRVEALWFDKNASDAETGFLIAADLLYSPQQKKYSGNVRLQYFETDGYNSRLYAYEDDVLYSYSIPVFYGRGYRYYLVINYVINKKLALWIRLAQSVFPSQHTISSYLDEITGDRKTEAKLQILYKF